MTQSSEEQSSQSEAKPSAGNAGLDTSNTSPQREGSELIEDLVALAISDGEYLGRHGLRMPVEEVIAARARSLAARVGAIEAAFADRLQALEAENERLRGAVSSAERRVSPSGRTDAQSSTGKPVAWRCKDYSDSWIYYRLESQARAYAESTGCLIEGLYPGPDMIFPQAVAAPPAEDGASVAVASATCAGKDELDDPLSLAEAKASTAEAEIARLSRERAQALESAAEWRRVGHDAKADALAAKASLARAVEVLEEARFALAEFYRYQHGGDGRNGGSYDGKPEREGLWRAERAVAAFLASLPKEKTHEG